MKKHSIFSALFLALCLLVSGFGAVDIAKADVLSYPDSGSLQHFNGTTHYICREFTVESEKGYVETYAIPTSTKKINQYANGEVLYIYWEVELPNGQQWGWITNKSGPEQWVRMDDLKVIYDNQSFWEDHKGEILKNDGSYDYMLDKYQGETKIVFWKYPNSGIVSHTFTDDIRSSYFQSIYKDEQGRVWGYCGYLYCMSGWMLFNDPSTTDLSTLKDKEEVVPTATIDVTVEPTPTVDVTVTPSPEIEATESPIPTTPVIQDELAFECEVEQEWMGGSCVRIDVMNNTDKEIKGWKMEFKFNNKITSLWEAKLVSQKNGEVTVESAEWASPIKPGEKVSFFFNSEGARSEAAQAMQGKAY